MKEYKELSKTEVIDFIKNELEIFSPDPDLSTDEIGDGNINWVYRIKENNTGKSIIVKQALPYVRIFGKGWPLSLDRSRIEAQSTRIFGELCPGNVPEVIFHDSGMALTVFEDLGNMNLMRYELMEGKHYPVFPNQMGRFLAKTFLHTSDLIMKTEEKKENVKNFVNPELCKITEDLILTEPFMDAERNNVNPELRKTVKVLWRDKKIRLEATRLKELFMNKAQSLVHGDLHTGSIFIDENRVSAFDSEFAFYGPASFDMGLVIGNLLLNYAYWEIEKDIDKRTKNRKQLFKTIEDLVERFVVEFDLIWEESVHHEYRSVADYKQYTVNNYLKESIGFAGCECIRRSIGFAQIPDFTTIDDLKIRATAQGVAISFGSELIHNWSSIDKIGDLFEILNEESKKSR